METTMPIPSKELHLAEISLRCWIGGIWQAGRKIVIKEIEEGENIAYYRDENEYITYPKKTGRHYNKEIKNSQYHTLFPKCEA